MTDRIEFERRPHQEGDHSSGIRIRINGHELTDLVREVEASFAGAEGASTVAGAYAGLPPSEDTCPPSRHFLGAPSWQVYDYSGKTQILQCECGEPGCWPLVCRIDVSAHQVIWADFEQPHRTTGRGRSVWTYDRLGPFTFERQQYDSALEVLRGAGEQPDAADGASRRHPT
jgi:hypothetical protein